MILNSNGNDLIISLSAVNFSPSGIDTGKTLLEEIRKDKERKSDNQTLLFEPLLALTGSLTLSQQETVSNLHKCDIPTQLYLSGKLGIPEAIL